MAELSIARSKLEEYKCSANDVIHFKLVRDAADLADDSITFHPDMSHQIFGESENIFGYRDLRVEIFCSAACMNTFVSVKYTDKVSPEKCDGVSADNILNKLNEKMAPGYVTNRDEFIAHLTKDAKFKPFGKLVHSYAVSKGGCERKFEIYKTGMETPGFRAFHERVQPFLLFYVDAASYIDVDDDSWAYYLVFEKYKSNGNPMHAFVGYMTVYNYYAYPDKVRPRISQVLILPPFQRQGHCATLMQTFYNECYTRPEVLDITVEDPSENFQRVRDFVDATNCSQLKSFQPKELCKGFSDEMVKEAREELKINRKQARRLYEILRLKSTSRADKANFVQFRLDIKKRLNAPFQKNGRDFNKLQRVLNPLELAQATNNMTREQRIEYLEKAFEEVVSEYSKVIERLAL